MSKVSQTPEVGLPVAGGFILRPATAADARKIVEFADLSCEGDFIKAYIEKYGQDAMSKLLELASIRLYEGASFSPDRLHNRPEAARYLLTLVTAYSDRDTHTLSKFS
jgi:hypothetical protein